MEVKEEISDTDSGIILHSGPDSPTTIMKDVVTHTRAVKLKHQSLEDRLELCLLELKKLCIREAELTGRLSEDYPHLPGEKPPHIRRRIGAAFKLDEQSIPGGGEDSELISVEAELALQLQIYEAARRLCGEQHLSKAVKRSRVQQCKREEKKIKVLQDTAFQLRLQYGRSSPRNGCINRPRDQGTSDDSSLSDSAVLEEEEVTSQSSHQPSLEPPPHPGPADSPRPSPVPSQPSLLTPHQSPLPTLEELRPSFNTSLDYEAPPIEHSPWTESSLDQPYQKTRKSRSGSTKSSISSCSSAPVTPVLPPVEACMGDTALPFSHMRLCHMQSNSAPTTPEMHLRRQLSLRIPSTQPSFDPDQDRGRTRGPRRRLTDYMVTTPEPAPPRVYGNPMYYSGSEDSNSEHSAPSYASSPCGDTPCDLPRQVQQAYRYQQHSSPNDNHNRGPLAFPGPGPSFYQNPQPQSSPSFHRGGYLEDGLAYPPEMDMGRIYHSPLPPPSTSSRYEYWYEEAPVHPQLAPRPLPPHVRLSRAPSLREYSQHQPFHPSIPRGLPRQVVNEELKSWHHRNQFREPCRPRSLDRQGAVRVRNVLGHESPLSQHRKYHEQNLQDLQAPHKRVLRRAADGTPVQWLVEEDAEIVSQV